MRPGSACNARNVAVTLAQATTRLVNSLETMRDHMAYFFAIQKS